jgi:ssDNA-binding Zn-finger/Zn-ribbon topoisomerase 1
MTEEYKTKKLCPVCGSSDQVYRSRARNNFEKMINDTKILSMYRCHNCNWRGIRFRKIKFQIKFTNVVRFIILIFISYFFVLFILKQVFKISYFK